MKRLSITFFLYLFSHFGIISVARSTEKPLTPALKKYCSRIDKEFKRFRWGESQCASYDWHHVRNSVSGLPLIWATFGEEKNSPHNTTMIMCGVHGDEITPIKLCFDILQELKTNGELFKNRYVIVAPIVNPDSFFKVKATRTNARGVDINRNFPTKDWNAQALKLWRKNYRSDRRRFPGNKSLSEPEVVFQVNLIKLYSPGKIISVHAPLTMLDYDGPDDLTANKVTETKARELLIQMSQKADGYKVKVFPYFPGSLGNYAGFERQIPTYTLELPSSDPSKTGEYWKLFRDSIALAINKELTAENSKEPDKNTQEEKPPLR